MTIKTYLINMDRSPDRLDSATEQLCRIGLGFKRIAAVDGARLTDQHLSDYDEGGALHRYGRTLAAGEIGCYLSHVDALKRFLESDAQHALVLEDDMRIDNGFLDLIRQLEALLADIAGWHVVNLGNHPKKYSTEIDRFRVGDVEHVLCAAHHFPSLTTGLFWSREGAEAFLRNGLPATAPVDQFLRDWCIASGRGLAFLDPPVKTTGAESQIDFLINLKNARRGVREASYILRKIRRSVANNIIARRQMQAFRTGTRHSLSRKSA
ncbi:glycosyltransferase family 25 protein [Oricola sp.]|uniref:glycosyltransferase family 25 protein n=1 Tax=Oricola sp. TaxID=1979950 RepID=UPI003BAB6114